MISKNKILNRKYWILIFVVSLLNISLVFGSDAFPVYKSTIEGNYDFLINNWDNISFKELRANDTWVNYVNTNLNPLDNWNYYGHQNSILDYAYKWKNGKLGSAKCLGYSASTVLDWFAMEQGFALKSYNNILNNRTEIGHEPRELETVYLDRISQDQELYSYKKIFPVQYGDPVTYELIPYNLEGYSSIITNPPSDWVNKQDPSIQNSAYKYTFKPDEYLEGWKYISIATKEKAIREALEKYGILYVQLEQLFYPVHAVTLIGYKEDYSLWRDAFWIHETYDEEYDGTNTETKYKGVYAKDISNIIAFYDPQWPTFHHDNRRTGFTLLKGDISSTTTTDNLTYTLDLNNPTNYVSYPSIADIDNDGKMEVVVTVSNSSNGKLFALEWNGNQWNEEFSKTFSQRIIKPPSIANIDKDGQKEIVFGTYRGWDTDQTYVYAVDGKTGNTQFKYPLRPKWEPDTADFVWGDAGVVSVADLDLDGNKEIIFTEWLSSVSADWPAELYVLDYRGVKMDTIEVGNDGAQGAPSIADIDDDNLMEIFVPTQFGVKVFEYTGRKLKEQSFGNNQDGLILGSDVIYDIDRDGEYEIIYVTTESPCWGSKNCDNQLYIKDKNGNNEQNFPKDLGTYRSWTTPAIADIQGNNKPEILLVAFSGTENNGYVLCYDAAGNQCSGWPFNDGGNYKEFPHAPVIADITGDDDYNIVFGSNDSKVYVLDNSGNKKFQFQFSGELGSSPAIGDVDDDKTAELMVKHKGSPTDYITALSNKNKKPILNNISNITGKKEGDLVFINQSGQITATDPNNDSLTFYYSYPFNESGYWKTKCEDAGNHTVLIEVSDGNLTDSQLINVEVKAECPRFDYHDPFVGRVGNVTIVIDAYEPEGESITYYISDNRFTKNNNVFTWNPIESDIGTFPVNISISDGTINNTQEFNVTVVNANNQTTTFSDGSSTKLLTYTGADNQTVYIKLKKGSKIVYTGLRVEGLEP